MTYSIKKREPIHGFCPPGYEKVSSYSTGDGNYVSSYCRKIKVEGKTRAIGSGLYNEGMIAQEDIRLGFDSIVDSTKSGEKNAMRIKQRADKIETIMQIQERRKEEVKRKEEE